MLFPNSKPESPKPLTPAWMAWHGLWLVSELEAFDGRLSPQAKKLCSFLGGSEDLVSSCFIDYYRLILGS